MRVSARLAPATITAPVPGIARPASQPRVPFSFRLVLALFTIVSAARVQNIIPAL